jgi:hypothetical protein
MGSGALNRGSSDIINQVRHNSSIGGLRAGGLTPRFKQLTLIDYLQ